MSKEQIASIEYLNNKKEIDKYLDNLAQNLSICIKCLLEGEQGKYIHYTKKIQDEPCPSIFKDMYVVINNILKNSFDGIENLYIYIECENSIKIDECCVTIKNNVSNSTKNTTAQNQNNKNQLAPNVDIKAIQESAKNSTKYKETTSEKIYKVLTSYETSVATTAAGELPNVVEKLKDQKILKISDDLLKLSKTLGETATAVSVVSNTAVAVKDPSYFKRDLAQINILGTVYGGVVGARMTSLLNIVGSSVYDSAKTSDVKWQRDMASFLDNHAMSKAQEERSKFLTAGLKDGSLVANTQNKRIYSSDKITITNERANKEIKKQAAQNAKQVAEDIKKNFKNKMDEKKFQNMENIKNGNVDMHSKRLNGKSSNKNKPSGPNNRQ